MSFPVITPLQFGVPGGMELAVILLIAILLFGANKIPKLARSTGQAMGEFRRGREEIEQELEDMTGEGAASASTGAGSSPSTTPEPTAEAEPESEPEAVDEDTDETK